VDELDQTKEEIH
jgi:hypothetical protein